MTLENEAFKNFYLDFKELLLRVLKKAVKAQELGQDYYILFFTELSLNVWENMLSSIAVDTDNVAQEINSLLKILSKEGTYSAFRQQHVIFRSRLKLMTDYLVDYYVQKKKLSTIIGVDFSEIDNMQINFFLYHYVADYLKDKYCEKEKISITDRQEVEDIVDNFLGQFEVFQLACCKKNDFIKKIANKICGVKYTDYKDINEINAKIFYDGMVNKGSNYGVTWAFKCNPFKAQGGNYFNEVNTNMQYIEQRNFVYSYKQGNQVLFVGNVYFRKDKDDSLICVPELFFSEINFNSLYFLHKKLVDLAKQKGLKELSEFLERYDSLIEKSSFKDAKYYAEWILNINKLIMLSSLMKRFVTECTDFRDWQRFSKEVLIDSEPFNYENLMIYFGDKDRDISLEIKALEQMWDLEISVESLLNILSRDCRSIMISSTGQLGNQSENIPIYDERTATVEDTVNMLAYANYYSGFVVTSTNVIFTQEELGDRVHRIPFAKFWKYYEDEAAKYKSVLNADLNENEMFALLSQLRNLDTFEPLILFENNVVSFNFLPTLNAFCLLPIRYQYFLYTFDMIWDKYSDLDILFEQEIEFLFEQYDNISRELIAKNGYYFLPHFEKKAFCKDVISFKEKNSMIGFGGWKLFNVPFGDIVKNYKYPLDKPKEKSVTRSLKKKKGKQ